MKVLLIIPAFNEANNILNVYNSITSFNEKSDVKFDVIVINDGSTDNTEQILNENAIPHVSLINNLGIGGAVQTGYKYAKIHNYDYAVQFDGDGQHDVNYVLKILEPAFRNEADMIIGSRFIDKKSSSFKSSFARRVGIKMISFFIKIVTGTKVYDTTSGFRAVNRELIDLFANEYPSEYPEPVSTTKVLINKFKVYEVAVSMNERKAGVSSIRAWKNFYYMFNVIISILITGMEGRRR